MKLLRFKSPSHLAKMNIGDRAEAFTAWICGGQVVKRHEHDVDCWDGDLIECKSRTQGTDGRYSRVALFEKYFNGRTNYVALYYFNSYKQTELALVISTTTLRPHFYAHAKLYKGRPRWRPSRAFIEGLGGRDITADALRIEALL